jgi:peptidoglycan/LPS O-acetylase OafA/YrhL
MRTTSKLQKSSEHIYEFDILRAIAISVLMLHHGGIYNYRLFGFPLSELNNLVAGYLLGIFFFVSGALIVGTIEKRSLSDYFRLRFLRIYPPYWLALILFLVLILKISWDNQIIHLLGLQIFLAPRFGSPIYTLWFIGLIVIFYLIFGILLKFIPNKGRFVLAGVIVFVTAALLRKFLGIIEYRFFWYYGVFFAGILLAKFNLLEKFFALRYQFIVEIPILVLSIILVYPYRYLSAPKVVLTEILRYDFFILAAIMFTLSLARLLTNRGKVLGLFQKLTYLSFFAYLYHRPFWALMLKLYTPPEPYIAPYLILVGAPIIFALTYGMQKVYDRIYRSLAQKLLQARIAPSKTE